MIFNGIEKEYLTVLRGRKRPAWAPIQRNHMPVTGMPGAHPSGSQTQIRQIDVPILIQADSFSDLQKVKEDLAEWLIHDKAKTLKFKDEPDRTYYAEVQGGLDLNELVRVGSGVITFICPDPYKYGPEKEFKLSDIDVVENKGTAPADPTFELTATQKSTFAMVSNADDEYNLIGIPADDDVEIVDTKTSVLYESGNTIDTWATSSKSMVDDYFIKNIAGTMGTDDAGIRANGYGTGDKLHGPAVYKEINPIQDFEIESTFDIISRRERESWRMGINFLDENMNMIGHIGIKDNSRNYKRRTPLARYGPYRGSGRGNGNLIGDTKKNDRARETTLFYLRAKRVGNVFDFYIGEWQSHKHIRHWHETYHDVNNEYNGRLKYISLYIASYADRVTPSRLRINSVEVFRLAQTTVDQTPYILYPGDIITYDHKNEDILINGEPRNDLKNFGGSFFTLKKGFNSLVVTPADSFDTSVKFKNKYL